MKLAGNCMTLLSVSALPHNKKSFYESQIIRGARFFKDIIMVIHDMDHDSPSA